MKYDNHESYISELFMIESFGVESLKEYQDRYGNEIQGYIVGHWTNEDEEFEYGKPLVFRNYIPSSEFNENWLGQVDHDTEFVGILFSHYIRSELPKEVEYTLFIDTINRKVGYFYIGVGLED